MNNKTLSIAACLPTGFLAMKSRNALALLLPLLAFGSSCGGPRYSDQRDANPWAREAPIRHFGITPGARGGKNWFINCTSTHAIAWERDYTQNEVGAPPVTRIFILDIPNDSIVNSYTVTRGPYDVMFSDDQRHVVIDDYVIGQASGEIAGMAEDIEIKPEHCPPPTHVLPLDGIHQLHTG